MVEDDQVGFTLNREEQFLDVVVSEVGSAIERVQVLVLKREQALCFSVEFADDVLALPPIPVGICDLFFTRRILLAHEPLQDAVLGSPLDFLGLGLESEFARAIAASKIGRA